MLPNGLLATASASSDGGLPKVGFAIRLLLLVGEASGERDSCVGGACGKLKNGGLDVLERVMSCCAEGSRLSLRESPCPAAEDGTGDVAVSATGCEIRLNRLPPRSDVLDMLRSLT